MFQKTSIKNYKQISYMSIEAKSKLLFIVEMFFNYPYNWLKRQLYENGWNATIFSIICNDKSLQIMLDFKYRVQSMVVVLFWYWHIAYL